MLAAIGGGWTMVDMAIFLVVMIGIVGIVYIVAKASGVPIPAWVFQIAGLVVLIVVAIFAIRLIASM